LRITIVLEVTPRSLASDQTRRLHVTRNNNLL